MVSGRSLMEQSGAVLLYDAAWRRSLLSYLADYKYIYIQFRKRINLEFRPTVGAILLSNVVPKNPFLQKGEKWTPST